jgi:uncharacterized protein YndB with AHSA1/START domain
VSAPVTIEHTYPAPPERIWELWTTAEGIESWWAPDGFRADVQSIDVRPGGELHHSLTAVGPDQIAFMEGAGLPLTSHARKRFDEVDAPRRLAYTSFVDFVPGVETYEQRTTVELHPEGDGTRVVMTMEPMHDDVWTERLVAGRANELENLARVL